MRRLEIVLLAGLALAPVACSKSEPPPRRNIEIKKPVANLLKVGDPAPSIKVKAHTGEELELSKLGKVAVVYFYPKDDTPGCTTEAKEIRDVWDGVKSADALVIGVSSDGEESHKAFAEKYELPFFLVPDESHVVANAFGVAVNNGKASRVSFVISPEGKITKVFPKVKPKGHGVALLAAITEGRAP